MASGGAGAVARAQFWAAQTRVAAGGTAWPSDCWPDRAVRQATMVARTGNLFCWLRQPLELSFVGSEPVLAL
jgi:hypothetical protein